MDCIKLLDARQDLSICDRLSNIKTFFINTLLRQLNFPGKQDPTSELVALELTRNDRRKRNDWETVSESERLDEEGNMKRVDLEME